MYVSQVVPTSWLLERASFSPCRGCSRAWTWSEYWDQPTLLCSTVMTQGKPSGEFHHNHWLHPIHTVPEMLPQGLHRECCTQVDLWACNTNSAKLKYVTPQHTGSTPFSFPRILHLTYCKQSAWCVLCLQFIQTTVQLNLFFYVTDTYQEAHHSTKL
jgi:hypothetical protein